MVPRLFANGFDVIVGVAAASCVVSAKAGNNPATGKGCTGTAANNGVNRHSVQVLNFPNVVHAATALSITSSRIYDDPAGRHLIRAHPGGISRWSMR